MPITGHNRKTNSVQWHVPSDKLCNDLAKFGVTPRKTKTLPFPDLPKENMRNYLRGYFYGDGCAHKYPNRMTYSFVGNRMFIESLKLYLETNTNINHCVVSNSRSFEYPLLVLQGKNATLFADFIFNSNKMILLPRKHIV